MLIKNIIIIIMSFISINAFSANLNSYIDKKLTNADREKMLVEQISNYVIAEQLAQRDKEYACDKTQKILMKKNNSPQTVSLSKKIKLICSGGLTLH